MQFQLCYRSPTTIPSNGKWLILLLLCHFLNLQLALLALWLTRQMFGFWGLKSLGLKYQNTAYQFFKLFRKMLIGLLQWKWIISSKNYFAQHNNLQIKQRCQHFTCSSTENLKWNENNARAAYSLPGYQTPRNSAVAQSMNHWISYIKAAKMLSKITNSRIILKIFQLIFLHFTKSTRLLEWFFSRVKLRIVQTVRGYLNFLGTR